MSDLLAQWALGQGLAGQAALDALLAGSGSSNTPQVIAQWQALGVGPVPPAALQLIGGDEEEQPAAAHDAGGAATAALPHQAPKSEAGQQGAAARQGKAAPAAGSAKPRPKNTKRYTSVAQKEAHKRYRERKRQNIVNMEAEVAAKLAQLQALERENAALKSKCRVLETSVSCSTQIANVMQMLDGISNMSLQQRQLQVWANGLGPTAAQQQQQQQQQSSGQAAQLDTLVQLPASSCTRPSSGSGDGSGSGRDSSPRLGGARLASSSRSSGSSGQLLRLDPAGPPDTAHGQASMPPAAAAVADWLGHAQQHLARSSSSSSHDPPAPGCASAPLQHQASAASCSSSGGLAVLPPAAGAGVSGSPAGLGRPLEPSSEGLASVLAQVSQGLAPGPLTELAGSVDTAEQGLGVYRAFLRTASQLMLQAEAAPAPEAAAAVESHLDGLTRATIARLQPFLVAKGQGMVYDLNQRNLETGQRQEAPAGLWPRVLQLMRLTPQQQQDALACWAMFGACLAKLLDERTELARRYHALQAAAEAALRRGDGCEEARLKGEAAAEAAMSGSMELLQLLAKSLASYQTLDGVFAHSVTSIMSGAQMAVACVQSWPFLPQWHQLMRHLQQQHDDAAAAAAAAGTAAEAAARAQEPTSPRTRRAARTPRTSQLVKA